MSHVVDKFKLVPKEGYATQMPYGHLMELVKGIPQTEDDNSLFDIRNCDDVGVYKVSEDAAVINVMDYLTAYMDEPYDFGRIVAANGFSYVYALGGHPTHALNMLCFPGCLDISVAGKMMEGSAHQCMAANCVVAGGHSIMDDNPKYGLNINGIVDPKKMFSYSNAKAGEKIIITKKQGTGVINTALTHGECKTEDIGEAIESMAKLDKDACEAALEAGVRACTNINNYGLFGRVHTMAEGSGLTAKLDSKKIPTIKISEQLTGDGWNSPGNQKNREFCTGLAIADSADETKVSLGFDPQVSGGLLFSVAADKADAFLSVLREKGYDAEIIGELEEFDGQKNVYVE